MGSVLGMRSYLNSSEALIAEAVRNDEGVVPDTYRFMRLIGDWRSGNIVFDEVTDEVIEIVDRNLSSGANMGQYMASFALASEIYAEFNANLDQVLGTNN